MVNTAHTGNLRKKSGLRTNNSRAGDVVVVLICCFIIFICILPIINIAVRSVSSADALIKNQVTFWPVGFTLESYSRVLTSAKYTNSLAFTAWLTVLCVGVSLVMTTLCAFPLTFDNLPGKKFLNTIVLITMYFGAGTIPTYLLIKQLGLLENWLVLVLPSCLSVFNMILMRSFFYGIPASLRESAEIDGAGPMRVLLSIYIPLSLPVIATLALFYAVGRWNGYTDALYYIKSKTQYHPIQLLLYNLLNNSQSLEVATQEGFSTPGAAESIKSATVMFATVPILLVYPWLQKYFISGVTLGAVKE
ncbi:MAG: carbohydrate ABC transporter permease [Oscillospiraceae bacterium]|jgi:putative aldouronate transport system permease protein|nr:carbohydrate ABC transporter permease [Oscillospiraceae bacterium]